MSVSAVFRRFQSSGLSASGYGALCFWMLFFWSIGKADLPATDRTEGTVSARRNSAVCRLGEALGMELSPAGDPKVDVPPAAYAPYAEAAGLLSESRGEEVGRFVLTREALGRAAMRLQEALEAEPDFACARYLLSLMQARGPRYTEAVANYRRAARLNPAFSKGRFRDLFARTVADYQGAARLIAEGTQYLKRGRYSAAITSYRRAVRIMPDFADGRANLGLAFMLVGNYTRAVAELQEAIRLAPGLAEAYYNLGKIHVRQERYSEAVSAYREAIRLKPDDAPPDSIVGEEYAGQGEYTRSIARYQTAMRHAGLANAYFKLGDRAAAIAEYERVLKIDPAFADAHYNLGIIHEAAGETKRAIRHWQAYLDLAGEDPAQGAWVSEVEARLERLRAEEGR